jgi:urea transport system substrate-binding protein
MTRLIKRRSFLKGSTAAMGALVFGTTAPYYFQRNIAKAQESGDIKVGILHSLSGTIAIIETSLHNAELLAIEEINAKGGVNGKKLVPVVEDPQSLVQVFAEKAKKLLLDDKVAAVLGCYTSASRQSVLPVFEEYNGLLLYPTLYEAQECSKNCFYTGAVPNQQLDDFVPWIITTLGRKKFYMIGSNYIYPKETNREVKALLEKHGGENVGEEYAPLGHTEFSTIINNIAGSGADVVFSDLASRRPTCRFALRSRRSRKRRRWGLRTLLVTILRSTIFRRSIPPKTSRSSNATRPNMAQTRLRMQ